MTIRSAVLLALLMSAGFLGNYFTLPLFFGADFLFGSIAVLLVLYFYGLGWGMLAALVAYSYTWVLWGHPYGFINFMSEALFVGLFLKWGRRNLLALDAVFWLLLGAPLAWLYHGVALHMDATTATFIMLKQSINGIFNALLVSLAIYYLPLGKLFPRPQRPTEFSLRDSLFSLLVMLVLLPALLLTMLETRKEKANLEADVVGDLGSMSDNLQYHLHSWLEHHVQTVQELAKLAAAASMTRTDRLQHETNIMKRGHKDLLALQVINAAGRTIVFSPEVNEKGESNIGWDFSDRLWFKEPKARQQPMVGDIFLGRTVFADTPLAVVSGPVFLDKRWAGIAGATLDLTRLQEMIKAYSQMLGQAAITLTDSKGQVVVSTLPGRTAMQIWDRKKTGVSLPLNNHMYRWFPDDPKLPSMTRWKQSFYVQEIALGPELPWKLTIEVPVAPLQHTLYTIYVKNLTIMAILTALALIFSLLLSRWLTRPLVQLSQVTANLPEKLSEAQNLDWPASSALEINALIANSKSMAQTLEENFRNLQAQADELRQVNRELNREIQERQGAEESLRDNEQFLTDIFNSILDGLSILDKDLNILRVNPAMEKIPHTGPMIGGKCYEVYHGRREPCQNCPVQETLLTGNAALKEFTVTAADGSTLFVEIHTFPLVNPATGQVDRVIEYVRDITERKQAEQERLRLDKLESLGVLAGGIAHDFNNILMVILGSISLATLVPSVSEARESLAAAEAACGQGQSLARQLLTFAKGGAPIKAPQDLKGIIQEATRLALSGSQARVEFSLPEHLWKVEVDRDQMHQVFSNLLINADQAMPTGGLIQIQAENLPESEAIRLSLPPGKYVAVTLADQGVGIAPGHLERIFDPYFTTKQKGSGIGLATVYSIVTQHGGRITVDSCLGRGTSFRLYLPAIEGTVQDEKRMKTSPPKGHGRILVMDDEPLVREVVGKMLRALGYEPVFAQEGRESLELYATGQASGEPIDAVILDLTVPGGMGGMEAIQHLLAQDPQVKGIVSSGYGGSSIMADFKSHGFLGVIAKPYRLEELGNVLHEVLNA